MPRVFVWATCGFSGEPYPKLCPDAPGPEEAKRVKQSHTLTAEDELILEQTTEGERLHTLARRYPFHEKPEPEA